MTGQREGWMKVEVYFLWRWRSRRCAQTAAHLGGCISIPVKLPVRLPALYLLDTCGSKRWDIKTENAGLRFLRSPGIHRPALAFWAEERHVSFFFGLSIINDSLICVEDFLVPEWKRGTFFFNFNLSCESLYWHVNSSLDFLKCTINDNLVNIEDYYISMYVLFLIWVVNPCTDM
jgi:hypothetical protein